MRKKEIGLTIKEFTNQSKDIRIVCPVCGKEYSPSDIYVPDAFFGKNIVKVGGKNLTVWNGAIYPNEHFICEKCDTPLKISARIDFDVAVDERTTTEDYVATIYQKPNLMED